MSMTAEPYILGREAYRTKQDVTRRCREILASTDLGVMVGDDDAGFLLDLFRHHTEWPDKQGVGIAGITAQNTEMGTRCFCLIRRDGSCVDISFLHAIKHLPSARSRDLLPQSLLDFKNAARQAIKDQVDAIRCGQDAHVDHVYPQTFDALLFDFCASSGVDPSRVPVVELDGCVPFIADDAIRTAWAAYHRTNAMLRVIGKAENMSAPKRLMPWRSLIRDG